MPQNQAISGGNFWILPAMMGGKGSSASLRDLWIDFFAGSDRSGGQRWLSAIFIVGFPHERDFGATDLSRDFRESDFLTAPKG
jgi:hypothetical protein